MKKWFLILGGIGLAAGAYMHIRRQITLLKGMQYCVLRPKIVVATAKKVEVEFVLRLKNLAAIGFQLTGYDLVVSANKIKIARLESKTVVPIPAHQSVEIPFNVTFAPDQLGNSLLALAVQTLAAKTLQIQIQGMVSGGLGALGFQNLPLDLVFEPLAPGTEAENGEQNNRESACGAAALGG